MKACLSLCIALFFIVYMLPGQCPDGTPDAGYTCIPDMEFEEELVLKGIDTDGVIDGQVLTADISDETSLVMVLKGITDLTGIEDFTALQSLNVWGNPLGTLDVSNNPNLTTLLCYGCQLTQLTLPSSSSALTQIDCYNNNLTALDVSGLSNLATLQCYSNSNLASLDVKSNLMLTTLNAYEMMLTNLDVSMNTALVALRIENNQLSTLDISNNTQLEYLEVDFNPLTELDVSTTTKLNTLNAAWCSLQNIDVKNGYNNLLFNLDVTNNPDGLCIQVDNVDDANNNVGWNKDANADYMLSCPELGIFDNNVFDLVVYPNPARDYIKVNTDTPDINYSLYTLCGNKVKEGQIRSSSSEISLRYLSKGIYFIRIVTSNSQSTKKIVKY